MLTNRERLEFERRVHSAFLRQIAGQADELMRLLGNPPDVRNVPAVFWEKMGAGLFNILQPIILEMAVSSALQAGAGLAVRVNWGSVNIRAAQWASNYTFHLVQGITTTTRDMLRVEIDRYFRDAGVDLKTLAGRIQPNLGPLTDRLGRVIASDVRAEMVAVTEVTRAAAEGEGALVAEIKAANPNLNVVGVWLTSRDEIVCPKICVPLNGVRDDGKGNFINPLDGQVYRLPGHPRCRCARATVIAGLSVFAGL